MRQGKWAVVLTIALTLSALPAYANFNPYVPQNNTPTNATGSGSDLLQTMQQQTTQAMQIFQNVTYQKISGNQDQIEFFQTDTDETENFTIPQVQS